MIRAAALALGSALLGGAIALLARTRPAVLERTRTFAFAAAAGVVAFHLLPEVLPQQGLRALGWMAFGFALPWGLEASARVVGPAFFKSRGITGLRVAAEVGFAALVFHSVAEGVALVAALAQPAGKLDLEIALVAHHAPLTAAVVLPFLDLRGPKAAFLRAAAVGSAGVGGALLSGVLPGFGGGAFLLSATAATAGALLHVVSDEIRPQKFASGWERASDLLACLAGVAVAGLSAVIHPGGEQAGPLVEFARALSGVVLACTPALLCGMVVGALLALPGRFLRWDALLLALVLLGPLPAVLFGALSLVFALPLARPAVRPSVLAGVADAVRLRTPPLLLLLLVAAGFQLSTGPLPAGLLGRTTLALALLFAARLDQAGAMVVTAALIHKGLDPGLALGLVALGPLTGVAAKVPPGAVAGALQLVFFAALSLGAAPLATPLLLSARPAVDQAFALLGSPVHLQLMARPAGVASAALLLALAIATLWQAGVRGWLAPLRHGAI